MIWCLRCGGSYGSRPISEHVCNPRDIARQRRDLRTKPTALHHLNGNARDNRPENLAIVDPATHARTATPDTEEAGRE